MADKKKKVKTCDCFIHKRLQPVMERPFLNHLKTFILAKAPNVCMTTEAAMALEGHVNNLIIDLVNQASSVVEESTKQIEKCHLVAAAEICATRRNIEYRLKNTISPKSPIHPSTERETSEEACRHTRPKGKTHECRLPATSENICAENLDTVQHKRQASSPTTHQQHGAKKSKNDKCSKCGKCKIVETEDTVKKPDQEVPLKDPSINYCKEQCTTPHCVHCFELGKHFCCMCGSPYLHLKTEQHFSCPLDKLQQSFTTDILFPIQDLTSESASVNVPPPPTKRQSDSDQDDENEENGNC